MKFLSDMGISPRVVSALRERGHEAIHLQEQGLGKLPDGDILAKARAEGRVLLTHDLEFWGIAGGKWRGTSKCDHLSAKRHAR